MTVRNLEDLSSLERLNLIDMSYSRLDTYLMCALKYYYSYIERIERVFSAPAALGNVVHGTLEQCVGEDMAPANVLLEFEKQRLVYDPEHQIDNELVDAGIIMLREYIARHEGESIDIVAKEMPFAIVVGSALISGYIDIVEQTPLGIKIVDYKTGKAQVNPEKSLQLGIYALAMSHQFPDKPIKADLYYLRSGKVKGKSFTPEELESMELQLLEKINTMINDRYFKATEAAWPCKFCDFRLNGKCSIGVKRFGSA